jgi:hypothetical protein
MTLWTQRRLRRAPGAIEGRAVKLPVLTAEQHAALARFANEHGSRWKKALIERWVSCSLYLLPYGEAQIAALAQVRDTLGPSGLERYDPSPSPERPRYRSS